MDTRIKLLDVKDVAQWDEETKREQIWIRHKLIDQCIGSMYPRIYTAEIERIKDAMLKVREE